jgi:hypothetical protein
MLEGKTLRHPVRAGDGITGAAIGTPKKSAKASTKRKRNRP